jgi:tetratricopeptide (TPR) repeat protein
MLVAFVVAMLASAPVSAQVCIPAEAEKRLAECPGGKFKASVTKRPQVSFSSKPEGIRRKKRITTRKPPKLSDIAKTADRSGRARALQDKQRALLLTEIQNIRALYKSTPKNDKDRPQLMRRLAEGYVELESSADRERIKAEIKASDYKRKGKRKKAAKYKRKAKTTRKVIKAARKRAIKWYRRLKSQYPDWCQFPKASKAKRGCTDEVLYYLAYEYEQAGNLEKARKAYLELTENWKDSRFVPNAYLAFGELFFNEAQGDPRKWPVAENFYKEVLKFKAPENKLWGYAAYKLGYVYWNQGIYDKAINEFKRVIEFGTKFAQLPNAKGLARSARRDIIPVYALKGNPAKAYVFFRPLSGDSGVNSDKTYKMMEELGHNLVDTGHYAEAIVLYNDLKKRNRGDNYCFYQVQISKAVMASKSGQKVPIVKELLSQLEVHKIFAKGRAKADKKLQCANDTAGLMTETAMAWHLEAVGSGGVRGTGDPKTMTASEKLYSLVVTEFTAAQFISFKFPRIMKEDWPTIPKIRYAMADLLYFQKKWSLCGPAFDSVVAEDPNGSNAAEAAFASVLCYQNIYAEKHKGDSHRKGTGNLPQGAKGKKGKKTDADKFKAKAFTNEQKGMITAFNRYVCYIKPKEGDRESLEQYVEVKFARARTYFEVQHWAEAAAAFRDVAINHPDMDAGIYAAQLYLESLNIMGSKLEPTRPDCYDNMAADVPVFLEKYCTGSKREENDEQCGILDRIQRDIERLQAEEIAKKANKLSGRDAIKLHEKAAALYLKLWKKYGEEACLDKKPACERNEEILYNAAEEFQAARLIAKAIGVRRILINPKYGLEKTKPARKAVYKIGANYQAIAVYEEAAKWYERFAAENPKMENAADALSDAVVLRLGLGQATKALDDARLFNQKFRRKTAQAAKISFAIGAYYIERGKWKEAEKELKVAMPKIEKNATVDVKLQARALLGQAYAKQRRTAQADKEYGKVRAAWADPGKMMQKLNDIGGSQAAKVRRIGKVLTAVGEALYHFAEKKRVAAEAIKFPVYKGSGERKEVQEFIEEKVKKWMQKKEPAILAAQAEYLKIVKLKPEPPPRWVIAAGSAVGALWGSYVEEFRSAPYPKEWDKKGASPFGDPADPTAPPLLWLEIRGQYLASLDAASEKQKRQAKGAFQTCLAYSVKYQYFDQDSRSCEKWLSKKYPAEFHLIDEYGGSPTRVNSPLDERPPALNIDGTPAIEDTRGAAAEADEKDEAKADDGKAGAK